MNDPGLIEELEEVFQSAHDHFVSTFLIRKPNITQFASGIAEVEEEEKVPVGDEIEVYEPRQQLPFFKDPKIKISIWTIIKDSIGKDLSKMAVPVYFNSPTSLLQ